MNELLLDCFGLGASVEVLADHDCQALLAVVPTSDGQRWVALAVEENIGEDWQYLTVPVGPDVSIGMLVDAGQLRSCFLAPNADVRLLALTDSGHGFHVPVAGPIPEAWLPTPSAAR